MATSGSNADPLMNRGALLFAGTVGIVTATVAQCYRCQLFSFTSSTNAAFSAAEFATLCYACEILLDIHSRLKRCNCMASTCFTSSANASPLVASSIQATWPLQHSHMISTHLKPRIVCCRSFLAVLISLEIHLAIENIWTNVIDKYTTWQNMAVLELLPFHQRVVILRPRGRLLFRSQEKISCIALDQQSRWSTMRVPYFDHDSSCR